MILPGQDKDDRLIFLITKFIFHVKLSQMKITEFHITQVNSGRRIDVQTSEMSGLTRSQICNFIEKGLLRVNNLLVKPGYKTRAGDIISITPEDKTETLVPEDLPVQILYIDDFLIVVNKPSDMVVYPSAGHNSGTLMNAVAYHSKKLSSVGGPLRPGVVHRLDKDTSGVMVAALDDKAYYALVEQFRARTIDRRYKAIVYGSLKNDSGRITAKIGRSESDRKKMSTKTRKGKEAVTSWKVLERFKGATLIEAKLGTGRTHQIRVHFSSIGHPVLGDNTYGKKTFLEIHPVRNSIGTLNSASGQRGIISNGVNRKKIFIPRQMLHAELLGFMHPITAEYMEFTADMPADMSEILGILRNT
jgi:23S rRNA pseudouridine1911/1915/1917 synthase